MSGRLHRKKGLRGGWDAPGAGPFFEQPWPRTALMAALALALLAYLGYFLIYVNFAAALLRFPFDYDQGEGFELYDTLLHSRGQLPYQNPDVYPFYTSIYPPVFHLVVAPLVWAFGPHLWTGRLVGFLGSLIAAAAISYAVFRGTRRRWPAAISGLAFLSSNYVYHIGPLFRQHTFMVMLETLAIVTLAGADDTRSGKRRPAPGSTNRGLALGLGLLLLAGFTKQLAIATAAAAFCWLFLRNPRRTLLAGLAFTAAFLALFGWLDRASGGYWFRSVVLANLNRAIPGQMESLYRQWFGLHYVLLLLALGRVAYETYFSRISIYAVWFFFAVAVGALSGKFGAGESYFVTSVAAACILSGMAAGELLNRSTGRTGEAAGGGWRPARSSALALTIPLLYLWQARLVLHLPTRGPLFQPVARALGLPPDIQYYDSQGYSQLGRPPDAADAAAGGRITGVIAATDRPPLSEEASFPLAVGREVVGNPFPLLVMHESGLFDPSEMIRQIGAQRFGVVIFRAQFYPSPVLQAIGAAYQPWQEIQMNGFTYRILTPRDR